MNQTDMDVKPLSVSELNSYIKSRFEIDEHLISVLVRGEISNYKVHSSGHHYFSLKDADSAIRCVMFKNQAYGLRFRPENGMNVIVLGKVSVYTRDGT
ncbi:MAG: exodeoxyribonuclease VII large subunit, partial [Oscillospiraceae bacterium]|nr:exodeoxyribonuclease VII large subunit [Oscillospiraceae bacterium]